MKPLILNPFKSKRLFCVLRPLVLFGRTWRSSFEPGTGLDNFRGTPGIGRCKKGACPDGQTPLLGMSFILVQNPGVSRMPPQQSACFFHNMDLLCCPLNCPLSASVNAVKCHRKIWNGMVRAVRKFPGIWPLFYSSMGRYDKL